MTFKALLATPESDAILTRLVDLEDADLMPGDVTGANGGVGSIALLSDLGYRVVASTGRLEEVDYLRELGAADIIDRRTLSEPGKPITSERWAGEKLS